MIKFDDCNGDWDPGKHRDRTEMQIDFCFRVWRKLRGRIPPVRLPSEWCIAKEGSLVKKEWTLASD